MSDALLFCLSALGLGLIGLPFASFLFSRLPGRGLTLARPLGLLLVGYPLWLATSLDGVTYARWSAAAAVIVAAAISAVLWIRAPPLRRGDGIAVRLWLGGELLFIVSFFGWTLLHSFSPDVWQTEKPMDMAIVNAINHSDGFPPHDPWLAGERLNYYYFGHYLVALLIRLLGIAPEVGFNLAVPFFYALCVTAVYGVAASIALAAPQDRASTLRSALRPGLAAAAFAMLFGNLAGAVELFEHPARLSFYDWWAPSRVVEGTANEFPFFSFLLADLHAHVMAVPFALVALAYSLQLALGGPRLRPAARAPAVLAELLLAALVLGSLYTLNSLDFPTAVVVALLALSIWMLGEPNRLRVLAWASVWLGTAVVLFLPFWQGFSPATNGVALVTRHDHFSRFAGDVALIYGLPFWAVAAIFARRLSLPFRYLAWGAVASMVALVLLSPSRLAGLALTLTVAAFALFAALASGPTPTAHRFVWLLIGVGIGLIAIGELVYVRDSFDGTASYRFNTVFKAGYQAWFLLAIAAACALAWNRASLARRPRVVWSAGLVLLTLLALVYPIAGSYSRSAGFARTPTLDGLRWLERRSPGDVAAIRWLRSRARGDPAILETVGRDFDPDGRARVSTFTGLPAVLGWAGHEVQWGHDELGQRRNDVRRIYMTRSLALARRLLHRYGVGYVFVGSLERRDYPRLALAKFSRLGREVFRSRGTAVFRIAGSQSG